MLTDELCLDNFWNVWEVLVIKHAINILPVVFN